MNIKRWRPFALLGAVVMALAVGCTTTTGTESNGQQVSTPSATPSAAVRGAGCLEIVTNPASLQSFCATLVVRITAQSADQEVQPTVEYSVDGHSFGPLPAQPPLKLNLKHSGWWIVEWKFDTSRVAPVGVLRGDGGSVEEGERAVEGKKPLSTGLPLYLYAGLAASPVPSSSPRA